MTAAVRRRLASVLAWLVGAVAAAAVGLAGLYQIEDPDHGMTGPVGVQDVLAQNQGDPGGAAPGTADLSPSPSPGPTPGDPPSEHPSATASPIHRPGNFPSWPGAFPSSTTGTSVFASVGGTIVATCTPNGAYLVSWSPADGYHVGDVHRGPASTAWVSFMLDPHHGDVVAIQCQSGTPNRASHGWDE